jgi:hypothetical protein
LIDTHWELRYLSSRVHSSGWIPMITNKYNAPGERYCGPPRQMNLELLRRNKFTRLILR